MPFAELVVEPDVKAAFIGRPIGNRADDVEFWACAGYDYVPIAMSMVNPGRAVGGTDDGRSRRTPRVAKPTPLEPVAKRRRLGSVPRAAASGARAGSC